MSFETAGWENNNTNWGPAQNNITVVGIIVVFMI